MKRRIIRSLFIGLLLLCVGGWLASYKYCGDIIYRGRYFWDVAFDMGKIHLWRSEPVVLRWGIGNEGWDYNVDPEPRRDYVASFARPYCLGFSIRITDDDKMVTIPLWFPTTISALALLCIWRWSRPKAKGRAFPVELIKNNGEQDGEAAKATAPPVA